MSISELVNEAKEDRARRDWLMANYEKLKELRRRLCIKQGQIARTCGVPMSYIWRVESGTQRFVAKEPLRRIYEAYKELWNLSSTTQSA